jgi:hypothetical protein
MRLLRLNEVNDDWPAALDSNKASATARIYLAASDFVGRSQHRVHVARVTTVRVYAEYA